MATFLVPWAQKILQPFLADLEGSLCLGILLAFYVVKANVNKSRRRGRLLKVLYRFRSVRVIRYGHAEGVGDYEASTAQNLL